MALVDRQPGDEANFNSTKVQFGEKHKLEDCYHDLQFQFH